MTAVEFHGPQEIIYLGPSVGGGATGCGVALDAATRGLRVGLVERDDFAAGTSSRSTKLVHGGIPLTLHVPSILRSFLEKGG